MIERLKGLPLTIILTVLIWMYAEAQFTAVQPDVKVNVQVLSASADYAVRVYDPEQKKYSSVLNLVATLQGPRNVIERIYQDSLPLSPQEAFPGLAYVPTAREIEQAIANGNTLEVDTLSILNRFDYFRSKGVTIHNVQPSRARIMLDRIVHLQRRVEFKSPLVDRFTLEPAVADVQIPSAALAAIGGADLIRVVADPQETIETLSPNMDHVMQVRFVVEYGESRDERIRVSPPQGALTAHVVRQAQRAVPIPDVAVWISGPPTVLSKYDIEIQPPTVSVTVSGGTTAIDALRHRLEAGGSKSSGVYAYLDVTAEDRPETGSRRRLRYVLPEGLNQVSVPTEIGFRMIEKAPPTTTPAER